PLDRSAAAAATPISRVRQQRVPIPFRGTPLREDAEAWCPVCLDDLAAKRVMTLQPCRHELHRTCGLLWLETREDWTSASCPMCRTRVRGMKDHKGAAMTPVVPLGSTGQPTWGYACTPFTINQLLRSTELRLEECTQQESAAAAAGVCGPEYMRDFAEEKERLTERTRILEQLRERVVNREDADDGAPQADLQRDRRLLEMLQTQEEQLRQMQQAPPIEAVRRPVERVASHSRRPLPSTAVSRPSSRCSREELQLLQELQELQLSLRPSRSSRPPRWNGYDNAAYSEVIKDHEKQEEVRKMIKAEKAKEKKAAEEAAAKEKEEKEGASADEKTEEK
ncbi:hypothetical protein PFISCL1PPCAC_23520, partial [Pristionchus fissidentatus]